MAQHRFGSKSVSRSPFLSSSALAGRLLLLQSLLLFVQQGRALQDGTSGDPISTSSKFGHDAKIPPWNQKTFRGDSVEAEAKSLLSSHYQRTLAVPNGLVDPSGETAALEKETHERLADEDDYQKVKLLLSQKFNFPEDPNGKLFEQSPVVSELGSPAEFQAFMRVSKDRKQAAIVMFYFRQSLPCFKFVKTFSIIATQLRQNFQFAAFECTDQRHFDVCHEFDAFARPSVKLFIPWALNQKFTFPAELAADPKSPYSDYSLGVGGSFDRSNAIFANGMSVHTLQMSHNYVRALQYAAKMTGQILEPFEIPLGLANVSPLVDYNSGQTCKNLRWDREFEREKALLERMGPSKGTLKLATGRVKDAISGLYYLIINWIGGLSDKRLSGADEMAIANMLELLRATSNVPSFRDAATLVLANLYSSSGQEAAKIVNENGRRPPVDDSDVADGTDAFRREAQQNASLEIKLEKLEGKRFSKLKKIFREFYFLFELRDLRPKELPELFHCTNISCALWMLMHITAEGAAVLADTVMEDPRCTADAFFFKRAGHILPYHLLEVLGVDGVSEMLRISSMDAKELIKHDPFLGCGVVPAFDVAMTFHNLFARFLPCAVCNSHFLNSFSRMHHGLEQLRGPKDSSALMEWPAKERSPKMLLVAYRHQPEKIHGPWNFRLYERRKLDVLRLWMWRLHNSVSTRVAARLTNRFVEGRAGGKDFTNCDIRWPPRAACFTCYVWPPPPTAIVSQAQLEAAKTGYYNADSEASGTGFQEVDVLHYLKNTYWPEPPSFEHSRVRRFFSNASKAVENFVETSLGKISKFLGKM